MRRTLEDKRRRRRMTAEEIRKWIGHLKYAYRPLETWACDDLIQKIRRGESLSSFDGDMPQPDSEDSYNYFVRRNPFACLSLAELKERDAAAVDARGARAVAEQEAWEAEQRERRLAKESEQQRIWEAEERRRAERREAEEAERREALERLETACRALFMGHPAVNEPMVRIKTGASFELPIGERTLVFAPFAQFLVPRSIAEDLVRDGWATIK
jgi:hypothetical protein